MLLNKCMRIVPRVVQPLVGRGLVVQQARTLFSPWHRLHRPSDVFDIFRDMEQLERQLFRSVPYLLRVNDIDNTVEARDGQYRLSVDLAGFKPEEIKLALDESKRRLTISAKCERQHQNGTRSAQEMSRTVVLPESIDVDHLTSALHLDGVLAIEAPFKEQPQQKQQQEPLRIPISRARAELEEPHQKEEEGAAKETQVKSSAS